MPTESDLSAYQVLREQTLQKLRNSLRSGQQPLADWQGGMLAVAAVPGAGKSTGMAVAAAIAVARHQLHPRKQLVVVTFTRSAAASIKGKIRERLKELLLPQGGFIVHTLHGLALHIASRHGELSQLNLDTSTLVTPNQNHRLMRTTVEKWMAANPKRYQTLLEGTHFDGEETERLRRQSVLRTEVLPNLANTVIREAKSSGLLPDDLWQLSQQATDGYEILAIAAGLYEQYEQLMRSRNFIDYDDMILAALRVLENPDIRQRWQNQVFAVFEDEAQDSSPLQERLLKTLATVPPGASIDQPAVNLVRVGDPNQAINSTFTPADPLYFNWFCETCAAQNRLAQMDQAGRSSNIIIDAANFVLHWVNVQEAKAARKEQQANNSPPSLSAEKASSQLPFRPQTILPVEPDDPQPDANPQPVGKGLEIYTPQDIYATLQLLEKRIIELFRHNRDSNAAILVRENRQGSFLAQQLANLEHEHQIKIYEVGEVERHSQIPAEILKLLLFIDRPHSPDNLKAALETLQQRQLISTQDLNALATYPEKFLYPGPLDPPQPDKVREARRYCCNLLRARLELPHYQLIPFLAMTLRYTGSELATVQKLSERLAKQTLRHSSLPATLAALQEIVSFERFEGVEEETDDQYTRNGQLTIITMHKAKGLDWDYVFLPFLHEDLIPGKPWVPNAAKFLGNFTLAEVARAHLRSALHSQYLDGEQPAQLPQPAQAWEEATRLKRAEEFRLLYVAMTRAKRLLWMSAAHNGPFRWSIFRGEISSNLQAKQPCAVISALQRQFPHSVMNAGEINP